MKKTLLASLFSISLLSGCSTLSGDDGQPVSFEEMKTVGTELAINSDSQHYEPSAIPELETVRISVNTAFLAAKPAYEKYVNEMIATPVLGNFFSATEAASTEQEKQAIYDALSPKDKATVDEFLASSMFDEVVGGLKDAAIPAAKSVGMMLMVDSSELLSQVAWLELLDEKNKLSLTTDQISYLNDSVISAYTNYQKISAFKAAK